MERGDSTLASVALRLAVAAALAAGLGPLAIHAGVVAPFTGFRVFGFGLLASIPIFLLSLAALIRTRGPEFTGGRRTALRAALLSGALAVSFVVLAAPSRRVPVIHDITTDPTDPPSYAGPARAAAGAGLDYPSENEAQQRAAYPEVAPIIVEAAPGDAYAAAQRAALQLGWEVVRSDPSAGTFEATSTSRLFRFVDDVAVRVRSQDGGSRIDVRSRSRVGKSDLGANAARILAFAAALEGAAK